MRLRKTLPLALLLLAGCAPSPALEATLVSHGTAPVDPLVDFPGLRGLCDTARARRLPTEQQLDATGSVGAPPTRVFDNLYFVGSQGVSSWAVATTAGIILIDALNNAEEARTIIEPGLRALGLDPAEIRYVVVTHAHGDHYGGARHFAERGARIVMSEIDWRELAGPTLQFDHPSWGRPPRRDIAVRDGHRLTLGDTSIELRVTRTHTPGTISPIIPVRDGARRHRVMLWGGTALNFGPIPERLQSYAAETERMRRIAARRGIEVFVSNHPGSDASRQRIQALGARAAGDPHPYVIGRERVDAVLARIAQCARANEAATAAEAMG